MIRNPCYDCKKRGNIYECERMKCPEWRDFIDAVDMLREEELYNHYEQT